MTLREVGPDHCEITWDGRFDPRPGAEAATRTELVRGIYTNGIAGLRKKLGTVRQSPPLNRTALCPRREAAGGGLRRMARRSSFRRACQTRTCAILGSFERAGAAALYFAPPTPAASAKVGVAGFDLARQREGDQRVARL